MATGASQELGNTGTEDPGRSRVFFDLMKSVRRRWRLVVACIAGGAVLAAFAAVMLMPRYTAKALLVFNDFDSSDAARRPDDGAVDTHVAMMSSHAYLDRVLAAMEKDPQLRGLYAHPIDIERHLKVMQELRSHLLSVNFTAKSPQVAAGVANAIARLYVDDSLSPDSAATADVAERQMQRIAELDGKYRQAVADRSELGARPGADAAALANADRRVADLQRALDLERLNQTLAQRQEQSRRQTLALAPPIRIYALARPPDQTSSARPILIVIPAILASALFGIALALMLDRFDPRIRDAADLRRALPLPVVGAVPPKLSPSGDQKSAPETIAAYNAAMQELAVNLFLDAGARRRFTVMVAAASASGQDDFALDLALAASRFKAVLIVVAGDENMAAHYADAADDARRGGARISCCSVAADQGRLLSLAASGALQRKLAQYRLAHDWIVLATAPAAASPAARVVARMADVVVVNVIAGKTQYDEVAALGRAFPMLAKSGLAAASRRRLVFALTNAEGRPSNFVKPSESPAIASEVPSPSSDVVLSLARERVNRLMPDGRAWRSSQVKPASKNGLEMAAGGSGLGGGENGNVAIDGAME